MVQTTEHMLEQSKALSLEELLVLWKEHYWEQLTELTMAMKMAQLRATWKEPSLE